MKQKEETMVPQLPTLEILRDGKVVMSTSRLSAETLLGSIAFLDKDVAISITLK